MLRTVSTSFLDTIFLIEWSFSKKSVFFVTYVKILLQKQNLKTMNIVLSVQYWSLCPLQHQCCQATENFSTVVIYDVYSDGSQLCFGFYDIRVLVRSMQLSWSKPTCLQPRYSGFSSRVIASGEIFYDTRRTLAVILWSWLKMCRLVWLLKIFC